MSRDHVLLVTGRLAEKSLRATVQSLASDLGIEYSIDVLPITVAALMTPEWIARRVKVPAGVTRLLIPGYCTGQLTPIELATGLPVERGPRDLRNLPEFFGRPACPPEYGRYNIEIVAEINHAPRIGIPEILRVAAQYADSGADVVDVGCEPGDVWLDVADCVRALRSEGHRVSIDSLNSREIEPAVRAGAELVLSVNRTNRDAAIDWGCEVVVVPDDPHTLSGLDATVDQLAAAGVPLRIDPILEPIGFGFAASLGRYLAVREAYPDTQMMMGIGNLTELTDVDSAGVNALLLGFCQELGICSVLTTQVINWARTSIRECDLARRLMYHAVEQQVLPKHLEARLLMLRDESVIEVQPEEVEQLARDVRDNNYRILVSGGEIHLIAGGIHLHDRDPLAVMQQLMRCGHEGGLPKNLDVSHAFYLGFEMCKALTADTLGKQYQQDEPLDWGFLTRDQPRHYLQGTRQKPADR